LFPGSAGRSPTAEGKQGVNVNKIEFANMSIEPATE
jgi:hypothetical protein